MANIYLVVSNAKSYLCKSTHTGTPYIKVSNSYLDLAETTTSGTQIKFQIGTKTYRPKQTYTTTSSRQSDYISTSGYSGVSSKKSISKYSGVSYYSGGISCSTVSETKASSSTVNSTSYKHTSWYKTTTSSETGIFGPCTYTLTSRTKTSYSFMDNISSPTTSYKSSNRTTYVNFNSFTWYVIATYTEQYPYDYDGMYMNAGKEIITVPVYSTSTAVGNLSSTTTYTRSSAYNTSSATTNAGISSTTALTKQTTRQSNYNTNIEA